MTQGRFVSIPSGSVLKGIFHRPLVGRALLSKVMALAAMAVLLVASNGAAQVTIPTSQIIGYSGDGAGNTLWRAVGIAVDGSGNVYVAGGSSSNAFKITPFGVITEIIDFLGDGAGNRLRSPSDIAVDGSGNVYVVGEYDNAFKITPDGVITEIIDATGDGAGNTLDQPAGIAVDGSGNVYVAGAKSDNAFKITPGGVITEIIDSTGDGAGNILSWPKDIAVDGSGNVYVTGWHSDNAFRITPGGVITEIIDATGDGTGNALDGPEGIAVDGSGNVYVAGGSSSNAFKITPGGVITEIIDDTGVGGVYIILSSGIAVDGSGNVYVTGWHSHNAFKITPGGVITEIIDSSGDGVDNDMLGACCIAVDGTDVYVVGYATNNVFKIGDVAGNGGSPTSTPTVRATPTVTPIGTPSVPPTSAATVTATPTVALCEGSRCAGDNDGNGSVDISELIQSVNVALQGCTEDTCQAPLPCGSCRLPATGQTTVYGPGSDGDLQAGVALSYTDNGDGTITDNNTGLMWEKKDNSGGIHDMGNTYTWSTGTNDMDGTITTTFLAALNGGFAGYTDWRIPNMRELLSIIDYGVYQPSVDPAFHQSATCTGCRDVTLATCSCTVSDVYMSATTYARDPDGAWGVGFFNGYVGGGEKVGSGYVRAVRGGL